MIKKEIKTILIIPENNTICEKTREILNYIKKIDTCEFEIVIAINNIENDIGYISPIKTIWINNINNNMIKNHNFFIKINVENIVLEDVKDIVKNILNKNEEGFDYYYKKKKEEEEEKITIEMMLLLYIYMYIQIIYSLIPFYNNKKNNDEIFENKFLEEKLSYFIYKKKREYGWWEYICYHFSKYGIYNTIYRSIYFKFFYYKSSKIHITNYNRQIYLYKSLSFINIFISFIWFVLTILLLKISYLFFFRFLIYQTILNFFISFYIFYKIYRLLNFKRTIFRVIIFIISWITISYTIWFFIFWFTIYFYSVCYFSFYKNDKKKILLNKICFNF